MKRNLFLLIVAFATVVFVISGCGNASHSAYLTKSQINSSGLSELAAPGNKVFIVWENIGSWDDESGDMKRLTKGYTKWIPVDSKEEADFVLKIFETKRRKVGTPYCWLTPEILTKTGELKWRGQMTKANGTHWNGYRATDHCFRKMLKDVFYKEPALAPSVKIEAL
ncbi:MAG: hypothetical protein IKZ50_02730 [Bacteroidales bacterium]|nr:hypothetical protein [Bacteroidales bacterium]